MAKLINHGGALYYISSNFPFEEDILAFDLDYTLIRPAHTKFPRNATDLKFCADISGLSQIIIVSNQKYASYMGKTSRSYPKDVIQEKYLTDRTTELLKHIKIPALIIYATHDNHFRKPHTGSWDIINELYMAADKPIKSACYIGDAAGRRGDFSDTDRAYVYNVNISLGVDFMKFMTPEEYFTGETEQWAWQKCKTLDLDEAESPDLKIKKQSMILMVGYPSSGKSTFAKSLGIPIVSRDILGTMPKCFSSANAHLEKGDSVIIDNLNLKKTQREDFINIAKVYDADIIIVRTCSKDMAKKLNHLRVEKDKKDKIPSIVYNQKIDEPDKSEGTVYLYVPSVDSPILKMRFPW